MAGKLSVLGAVLVLGALVFSGCTPPFTAIRASGNIVTREEDISGFDRVDASHAFKVEITQADTFSVVLRIDENVLDYLEVAKRGNTLRIGLEPGRGYTTGKVTMEATVTMPELTGLELSGACKGTITGFKSAKSLTVDVSGASHVRGDIESGDASIDASGASEVVLSGSAGDLTADASGASGIDLADFPVGDANVGASGASRVTVNASGTLDADASGASHVLYLGSPTLGNVDTSGASSVKRK
jgi:hypothetical protein